MLTDKSTQEPRHYFAIEVCCMTSVKNRSSCLRRHACKCREIEYNKSACLISFACKCSELKIQHLVNKSGCLMPFACDAENSNSNDGAARQMLLKALQASSSRGRTPQTSTLQHIFWERTDSCGRSTASFPDSEFRHMVGQLQNALLNPLCCTGYPF